MLSFAQTWMLQQRDFRPTKHTKKFWPYQRVRVRSCRQIYLRTHLEWPSPSRFPESVWCLQQVDDALQNTRNRLLYFVLFLVSTSHSAMLSVRWSVCLSVAGPPPPPPHPLETWFLGSSGNLSNFHFFPPKMFFHPKIFFTQNFFSSKIFFTQRNVRIQDPFWLWLCCFVQDEAAQCSEGIELRNVRISYFFIVSGLLLWLGILQKQRRPNAAAKVGVVGHSPTLRPAGQPHFCALVFFLWRKQCLFGASLLSKQSRKSPSFKAQSEE